jgi:hypothetical protein
MFHALCQMPNSLFISRLINALPAYISIIRKMGSDGFRYIDGYGGVAKKKAPIGAKLKGDPQQRGYWGNKVLSRPGISFKAFL